MKLYNIDYDLGGMLEDDDSHNEYQNDLTFLSIIMNMTLEEWLRIMILAMNTKLISYSKG